MGLDRPTSGEDWILARSKKEAADPIVYAVRVAPLSG